MAEEPVRKPYMYGADALHKLRDAGVLGDNPELVQHVVIHIKHDDYVVMYTSTASVSTALDILLTDRGFKVEPIAGADSHRLRVLEILLQNGIHIDGGHHKQWYLEQIASTLGLELPEHEEGIAP